MDGGDQPTDTRKRQRDLRSPGGNTVYAFESVICKPVAVRDSVGLGWPTSTLRFDI